MGKYSIILLILCSWAVAQEPTPQVIYFHASWCKYCVTQDKIVRDLPVSVLTVDVDKDPTMKARYRVTSLPTIVVLNKNSWDTRVRFEGVTNRETILKAIP